MTMTKDKKKEMKKKTSCLLEELSRLLFFFQDKLEQLTNSVL